MSRTIINVTEELKGKIMDNRKIELKYSEAFANWEVSVTDNGWQWLVVYSDPDYDKAVIIFEAFKKVGYHE